VGNTRIYLVQNCP